MTRKWWDLGLLLAVLLACCLGQCSTAHGADRAAELVAGGTETWLTAAPGVGAPDAVPVAYRLRLIPPRGATLSGLCGTIPVWRPPEPWPHPVPESCSARVVFDRAGYWTVVSVAWYLHEFPADTCYTHEVVRLYLVDEGPVFADGFESGTTERWRTVQ